MIINGVIECQTATHLCGVWARQLPLDVDVAMSHMEMVE